jgi:hypothetical protein
MVIITANIIFIVMILNILFYEHDFLFFYHLWLPTVELYHCLKVELYFIIYHLLVFLFSWREYKTTVLILFVYQALFKAFIHITRTIVNVLIMYVHMWDFWTFIT